MTKISYKEKNFGSSSMAIIDMANKIIGEYLADGMKLTLRQLYYQFVSRDIFPEDRRWVFVNGKWKRDIQGTKNADPNYKWLGKIISDARLAGLIDWDAFEDRARNIKQNNHWKDPGEIIGAVAKQFRMDHWKDQEFRVEVWIEKEALIGVIESICREVDVPFFACKGYVSQSEMWSASQRMIQYLDNGQKPVIIHLGDHDPSGIDMTRDIVKRQDLFIGLVNCEGVQVDRIALNMNQVEQYNPPPNPAKLTDSRSGSYIKEYGSSSWELDALEPRVMKKLIEDTVLPFRDDDVYQEVIDQENEYIDILKRVEDNWERI